MDDTVKPHERGLREFAARYESAAFDDVHRLALPYIPSPPGCVLDVGAGSGRDAAAFADRGWTVVAVEPAEGMRALARRLHPQASIRWEDDRLPSLGRVGRIGLVYDVIWLSAVWMHVPPADRRRAVRKLSALLRPGGRMFVSLREGPTPEGRAMFPASVAEVESLAAAHGVVVRAVLADRDALGREDVTWRLVVLGLPDDATGSLPTLRGIILQDAKSATYKLALLRALTVVADRSPSLVRDASEEAGEVIVVPLGLLALHRVRMFRPLLQAGLPQAPRNAAGKGLSFVKDAFRSLDVAPPELRPGAAVDGSTAASVAAAVGHAAATIARMPARHTTWPDGSPIFRAAYRGAWRRRGRLLIDEEFLWSFGDMRVPVHLWTALRRLAAWIEPALLSEWVEQMRRFSGATGHGFPAEDAARALRWIDPERDTREVRRHCERLASRGRSIHCLWADRRLTLDALHVDHCFPWAAWPCDDLWNLMPASRGANLAKRDKLVTAELLRRKRHRIAEWWHDAFLGQDDGAHRVRFQTEARTSLPLLDPSEPGRLDAEALLDAMALHRTRLWRDQRLPEWDGMGPARGG